MGMGKSLNLLISLALFVFGQCSIADDPCYVPNDSSGQVTYNGYGSIQACVDARYAGDHAGKNYDPETGNEITSKFNCTNAKGGACTSDDSGPGGVSPYGSNDATGPCGVAYAEMDRACNQVNENVVMSMLIQQLSGGAAAAGGGSARVASGAQASGATAAAYSTVSVGVKCYEEAKECVTVCEPIAKKAKEKQAAGKEKPTKDESDALKFESRCGLRKTSILAQMGGNIANVMAALANAYQAMQGVKPTGGGTPTTVEPPPFDLASNTSTNDYGPGPGGGPGNTGDPEYAGNIPSGKSSVFGSNEGAGTGGGFGAGGAYPGGAPTEKGGGAQGGGPFKDPGGGVGGGGGYSVSGVPFGGGGGGGYGGGRDGRGGDSIDLSKFLPGGEMDPAKRGLASVEQALKGQGITGANDLSNFEKVTRMMNKKRAALKP